MAAAGFSSEAESRAAHPGTGDHLVAQGGLQEADLVFHGHDAMPLGHQGERGEAGVDRLAVEVDGGERGEEGRVAGARLGAIGDDAVDPTLFGQGREGGQRL